MAGKALADYAAALSCPTELLCVPFSRTPAEGTHFRANASAAEWKRDRIWARANVVALRIGRLAKYTDVNPKYPLPQLDPSDYAAEDGDQNFSCTAFYPDIG